MIGLIFIVAVGVIFGLLFIVGMIFVYSGVVKKRLHQRIIQRTKDCIISGYDNFINLWIFGGIVLVNAANKKIGCVAPEGDWKEFVVINYADLMIDHKEEKNDEKSDKQPKAD